MPVKIVVFILGLVYLPFGVSGAWAVSVDDSSWDDQLERYCKRLKSLLKINKG